MPLIEASLSAVQPESFIGLRAIATVRPVRRRRPCRLRLAVIAKILSELGLMLYFGQTGCRRHGQRCRRRIMLAAFTGFATSGEVSALASSELSAAWRSSLRSP